MDGNCDIWKIPVEEYAPEKPDWAYDRPELWTPSAQKAYFHEKWYRRKEWFSANAQAYARGEKTHMKPVQAMTFDEFCGEDLPDGVMRACYKKFGGGAV